MRCTVNVTKDILWVGGNDRRLNLFENIYPIPQGVSYNAYVVLGTQTTLVDTADHAVADVFVENVEAALQGRALDNIIVNHMEPDHAATLGMVCSRWPEARIIGNEKTKTMIANFFDAQLAARVTAVKEGDVLELGDRRFRFMMAPMVHWPEVMVTYEETERVLFSADAFGTFGAISGYLFADEIDIEHEWLPEGRRYYTNIVGKYGAPVQTLLKKAAELDIAYVCPLHGPIWRKDLAWLIDKYQRWSTYTPEEDGVLVAYASIYGHTQNAAEALAMELRAAGVKRVAVYDVAVTHPSYVLAEAFRFGKMALLCPTYNMGLFPAMETLLSEVRAHALQNRTIGLVENGSWAPVAGKLMREALSSLKNTTILEETVTIRSAVKDADALRTLAQVLAQA